LTNDKSKQAIYLNMAEIIRMPKMSDTMTEGVIATWLKKVGDKVKSGDILAEVETDKATMELENYEDGVLLHIGVAEKEAVPVDGVIAIIGQAGEDITGLLAQLASGGPAAAPAPQAEVQAPVSQAPAVAPVDVSGIKAAVIRMPKMSDTMTDGVIAKWLRKVGDKVKSGDILAEVETDKATMELENYEDGTLLYIGVGDGQSVPVDGIIAIIGEAGADYQKLLAAENAPKAPVANATPASVQASPVPVAPAVGSTPAAELVASPGGRVIASPLAKRLAKEKGYDLHQIKGTGENGRIVKNDVESFQPQAQPKETTPETKPVAVPTSAAVYQESHTDVPVSQMRKVIAKRLSESSFTAPHFFLTMEIDMDRATEARASMNEVAPVKLSFNDLVIKAVAHALRKHPMVNASWLGDKIRINHHIHIGVAVAVEDGLLVPVVRFADTKSLSEISTIVKDLGGKAKSKKLQPADWAGNTFSISNLGMFGIEEFTSIINQPDSCIMSVGAIRQTPVVKDGQIKVGNVMKVTLACDHRVVDGATGAAFLQTFKQLMEDPIRMLV
jgi:pyruvate dehydrogenase E2 component (dihydrolipoamide acetyltransferase)